MIGDFVWSGLRKKIEDFGWWFFFFFLAMDWWWWRRQLWVWLMVEVVVIGAVDVFWLVDKGIFFYFHCYSAQLSMAVHCS